MMILYLSLVVSLFTLGTCQNDYPSPHIVILGASSAGKSSLANSLLGCDPMGDCIFNSTNTTSFGVGKWLGSTDNDLTIADTPGFGNGTDHDIDSMNSIIDVLDREFEFTNIFVLAVDGSKPVFESGIQNALKLMSNTFGEQFWKFLMVGVTKWPYDQASIDQRQSECDLYGDPSDECHNEAWFQRKLNQQFEECFNLTLSLTYAFMDSYSQSGENKNDPTQQGHWQEETEKLWTLATEQESTFEFLDVDDIAEENLHLRDIIDEEIIKLKQDILSLGSNIDHNREQISSIESGVALNSKHIVDANTRIDENTDNIDESKFIIGRNSESIDALEAINTAPVGTILAWVPKPEKSSGVTVFLPEGWQYCDGSLITQGPWAGGKTPDLNSIGAFLRGGTEDSVLEVEDSQIQDHAHEDHGHEHDCSASSTAESHNHGYKAAYSRNIHDNTGNTEGGFTMCHYVGGLGDCGDHAGLYYDKESHSDPAVESVSTSCTLESSSSGIGGVSIGANSGSETRPINMKVSYIIRVY